ncbi:MAG: transporter substrate-binding domain-containing protein [Sulfurimonas sp.]|nr:transporter substrate-binding domain-containing protein [Sulfurimonas sp.]
MKLLLILSFICLSLLAQTKHISVQFEWKHQFEFAGFYAAKAKGYYQDIGLDVSFREYEDGIDIASEVINKKATFGISSSSLVLERLQGKPVVLLASYFKQNALAILSKPDIKSPRDLKNKKIMAVPWELDHSGLGVMLSEFGVSQGDYELIAHDYKIDKFVSGEIDAMSIFITSQPYYLDKLGIKYNILNPANFGIFSYDLELFTSEDVLNHDSKMVKEFVEATNKGWQYALEHKEEIVELIYEKYTQHKSKGALLYEAHKTDDIFKRSIFQIGAIAPELIKLNVGMYEKLGLIKKDIKLEELISGYMIDEREIPSISLSPEQQEFLSKYEEISIAYEEDSEPFFIKNKDESYSGYIPELLKKMEQMTGIKFVIDASGTPSDAKIKKSFHTSKPEIMHQSDALLKFMPLLITKNDNPKNIHNIQDLASKRVLIKRGNLCFEKMLLQNNIIDLEILYADTSRELLEMLTSNGADAALIDESSLYLAKRIALDKMIKVQFSLGKYFDISFETESKELRNIFNTILNEIDAQERIKLKEKWFSFDANGISLLPKELDYLLQKKEIKYCIDPNWLPFEGLQDGKHIGLSADYFKLFEKNLGITMRLVPTKNWSESLRFIKEKKCDVLPLAMKTPQRDQYLDFTTPYISAPLVIVTKGDVTFIDDISKLEGKKIGITKDHAFNELFRQKYKNFTIVDVKDAKDGLRKVQNKELYGYAGTLYNIAMLFQQEFYADLKVTGKFDEEWKLAVGVREDEPMLKDIFNKAIAHISQEEKKSILNKWIAIKYDQGIDYTLVWKVVFVSFLVLLAIFFWNRRLSHLNKELTHARQIADEATRAKSNFLANMSHEIRTPMNAVLGMIHFMKGTQLDDAQKNYLKKIEKASYNLLTLIDDVLDFSKIEAKKLKINEIDFNLLDIFYNLDSMFKMKADEKGILFEIVYDETLPLHLHGDSLRLMQILTNLTSNALKFTHKGSITLRVEKVSEELFCFRVEDTGIGISKEQQAKLFEPFSQADESTTRKYGGTGLGLSISKELATLMQGSISLSSEVDKGSVFTLEVPLQDAQQSPEKTITNKQTKEESFAQSDLVVLSASDVEELFAQLLSAIEKRRPQLSQPLLDKLRQTQLTKEDTRLFKELENLIKTYQFQKAKELLDEKK